MPAIVYRYSLALAVLAGFGAGRSELAAQEVKFWDREEGPQICAALAVVGTGDAIAAFSTKVAISEVVPLVPGWDFDFDIVIPLRRRNLDLIQDRRKLPDIRRKELSELPPPDRAFYAAFLEAIERSDVATAKMFNNSADDNKSVVISHLNNTPEQYRGKIVTVSGVLKLLRRENAPRYLNAAQPEFIYTGFIVGPTKGAPPFTIVFTRLPEKMGTSEKLNLDVTFQGYFLGLVRFPEENGKKDIISPYLVGRSLIVHGTPPAKVTEEETPYTYTLIVWSFGGILGVVALGAVMMLWYRRHDRNIQRQLAQVRDKHQPFSLEPSSDPIPQAPVVETKASNGVSLPPT